jgi:hypothetical protein
VFPLRCGTAGERTLVRDFLRRAEFEEGALGRALGIGSMAELGRVRWESAPVEQLPVALRWCLNLFVRGRSEDYQESVAVCGGETIAAFENLGLLRRNLKDASKLVCPVWLYPVDGFVVASDRRDDPEGNPFTPLPDVVFPAIYGGTLRFLRLLPETGGEEALDLCGGSGIGALHLARTGGAAVTTDVAERSALFAEFNGQLNGANVRSLCGDVYAPVQGRQFKVITAHPPFVPATGQTMIYRDGGDNGEAVTRRIIEGLPEHLRVGGTCVILCVACDAQDRTFEQRAHGWLGEAGACFDLVFGLEKILTVDEVVESIHARGGQMGEGAANELRERLRSSGTRQFVYGALFLRRAAERVHQEPLRLGLDPSGTAADFERLLAWRRHCRRPDFAAWLAESRPRLALRLVLTARNRVRNGQLVPSEFVFSIEGGFEAALRPDAWIVPLVARLEGEVAVRQVFESARAADELPAGFTLEPFLDLVQRMIERGFLEVDFPR